MVCAVYAGVVVVVVVVVVVAAHLGGASRPLQARGGLARAQQVDGTRCGRNVA